MKKALVCLCLTGWVAALLPTTSWAQAPRFRLKVIKIFDADFNERPCPSCGSTGASSIPLGESQPGDSYLIEASVSGWDENPDIGRCDPGGDGCLLSDGDTACASKHCSDTFTSCFGNAGCQSNQCVRDVCLPNPAIGGFQWALPASTLRNESPGGFSLSELPCDTEACETCQDDQFDIEACEACSCFHMVPFPGSNCTCWAPLGSVIPACDPGSLVCHDKSSVFIDESRSDYLLFGMGTLVAVNITPDVIEVLAAINSGTGAGEGEIASNIGTLLLTSSPCSGGVYDIRMDNDPEATFLNDIDAFKLPQGLISRLRITYPDVVDPCVGVDCDDGDPCTIDMCVNSTVCGDPPECVNEPIDCGVGQTCCSGVCQEPPCGGGNDCTALVSSSPPNCAIDARQPSQPDGSSPAGWQQIELIFDPFDCDASALVQGDFVIEVLPDGTAPGISNVAAVDNTVTLDFSPFVELRKWTCFSHAGTTGQACLGYLPGNVNSDSTSNPAIDLSALIDCLNNAGTCDDWQQNINRDSSVGVADLTRLIDLFNAAASYDNWTGAGIVPCP